MKRTCTEPGCGTVFQTGGEDKELLDRLMAKHVAEQHVTIAAQHNKILTKCLAAFRLIEAGGKFTKFDADRKSVV